MDYLLPPAPLVQGLCVPILTALDAKGRFDAGSQEKLTAFLARGEAGAGAQALFTNGSSGEWQGLDLATRRQVSESVQYALGGGRGPRLWAGVSDASVAGVLAATEHAIQLGAAAAVVAPLAVQDLPQPTALFNRHLTPLFQRLGKGLPVFLYDNPEVYRRGRRDRLRTGEVKQLARLDYVCGVKVTADARTAGNYLKAARHFKARHEFGVYLGRALQAFPFFAPAQGPLGRLRERWRRYWVAAEPPQGLVPLSANLFPSAWRQAWAACLAGDAERMAAFEAAFSRLHQAFRFGTANKGVACAKAALREEGILASERLASGTPSLSVEERSRWMLDYRNVKSELARLSGAGQAPPAAASRRRSSAPAAASAPELLGFGASVVDEIVPVRELLASDAKQKTLAPASLRAGGVILNQLAWARALGLSSGLAGGAGCGEGAAYLRREAKRLGLDTAAWMPMAGVDADRARIFVDGGHRACYLEAGASAAQGMEQAALLKPGLAAGRYLVTEISLAPLKAVEAALKLAQAAGRESFLDLDLPPRLATGAQGLGSQAELKRCLDLATHLKTSVESARQLGAKGGGEALAKSLHKVLKKRPGQWVSLTDGAKGAWACDGKKAYGQVAFKIKLVDPTGCGDAFHAGLICGRAAGLELEAALKLACAAGAAGGLELGAVPGPEARAAVARLLKAELPLPALPSAAASASEAQEHLRVALDELKGLSEACEPGALEAAAALVRQAQQEGKRLHVTGVGKCEYVAGYVASSYSSTGTPAFFLHATEAGHGASGQVGAGDLVIAISNSGETQELKAAVNTVKKNGARVLGVGGKPESWLARHSDAFLYAGVRREGDALNLAPRNSVLAEILILNSLGVALQHRQGFTAEQFRAYHPGGSLGRSDES